jgi:hypothetical protein
VAPRADFQWLRAIFLAINREKVALNRWKECCPRIFVLPMALEPGFNSATQVDWELACERETVIRPLAQAVRLESWQVADAANAIGLGRSATYRLIALFKRRPKTSTLLPAKSGRRHSTRWLDPRVEAIVEQTIQKFT